ncbi:MAG TPA: glycosyltransferase [Opitutaceae bacterium]|nr:glycosyltransferase [Opitutaceae bacterium]
MHQPRVSIVLRSFNEAWALQGTLDALKTQTHANWELIAFDSGSTDGSVEMLRQARPARLIQMLPHEYKPGRVLNQGMRLAQGDRVIFLNADATPQGPDWLAPLVEALADPDVAAVYGRQVPRPDCEAAFVRDYAGRFGTSRDDAEAKGPFFSMVSSGLRRDAWQIRGFREDMQYSEDDEYTRWCRARGFRVAYCPDSVVMHSHNYTPRQAYKRCFGESWALAAVASAQDRRPTLGRSVILGWTREVAADLGYCLTSGRLGQFPSTARIRWQQRLGRLHGHQAGWRMHRTDHVL